MPKKKPSPELPELSTLPARLTYARERAQLSKLFVAAHAQIDASQLTRYEQGEGTQGIEAATLIKLAKALGVPVGWLIADEGGPGPVPVFREGGDKRRKSSSKPDGAESPK